MKRIFEKIYVGFAFLLLYAPILVMIVLSFNESKSRVKWGGFSLKWYEKLFQSSVIMEALSTTVVLALLSAVISVLLGVTASIGIAAMTKRKNGIILALTNIPMLNADIVTGIAMMLLFVRFLEPGFHTVLIAHITFNIPYVILNVLPKLKQTSSSTYEAALDLGATPVYAFFKIVLPDIFPGILSGFLMAVTMSLDDFAITYFTKSPDVNTLSTMIYTELRKGVKPEMYALSTIVFMAVLAVVLMVNLKKQKKET